MIDKSLNWMNNLSENLPEAEGYYFGINNTNGLVFIDPWWKSNRNRENTNIVVLGVTGAGMSFTTKLKVVRERGINYAKEK